MCSYAVKGLSEKCFSWNLIQFVTRNDSSVWQYYLCLFQCKWIYEMHDASNMITDSKRPMIWNSNFRLIWGGDLRDISMLACNLFRKTYNITPTNGSDFHRECKLVIVSVNCIQFQREDIFIITLHFEYHWKLIVLKSLIEWGSIQTKSPPKCIKFWRRSHSNRVVIPASWHVILRRRKNRHRRTLQ